jgi:glycosyltransferase involved in cell wall biosynthesis
VIIKTFIYDLLPILMPAYFIEPLCALHQAWLEVTAQLSGVICISNAVAQDYQAWLNAQPQAAPADFTIDAIELGADLENSVPTQGLPADAATQLEHIKAKPSFLMVATLEPRKAHLQTIQAFTQLWQQGHDLNLIIVGQEGWPTLPPGMRRTIPQLIQTLRTHPEQGNRLIWLPHVSDQYLAQLYQAATCLLSPSYGEGFGLPLIEAAQQGLPIIARDLAVTKEIVGQHAYYFDNTPAPETLAHAITDWLSLYQTNRHPKSTNITWHTWQQSAQQLIELLNLS